MPRTVRLAALALLALSACERAHVYVDPPEIVAFAGVRTHVHVEAVLGCMEIEAPVLESMGTGAAPFAVEAFRVPTPDARYDIGNPAKDSDIFYPSDPKPYPEPEPYAYGASIDAVEHGTRAFDLLVQPAPGTAPGDYRVRVRARGCGTEAAAELAVKIAGALDLGGFCGIITGATCGSDAACVRAGCGELCAGLAFGVSSTGEPTVAGATTAAHCLQSACTDPVPSGATCGCVMGGCAWRIP